MLSTCNMMTEKERILQHLVHLGRCILQSAGENKTIQTNELSDLKTLVGKADQLGVHGMACSDFNETEELL
jgi:hypothetical protein